MGFTSGMIHIKVHLQAVQDHFFQADESLVVVLAPEVLDSIQINPNKPQHGVNVPGFSSARLNKAGVSVILISKIYLQEVCVMEHTLHQLWG